MLFLIAFCFENSLSQIAIVERIVRTFFMDSLFLDELFLRCRLHLGFFCSMELSYLPTKIPNCPFAGSGYPGFPLKVHVTNKQHGTLTFSGFIIPTF